ncbi:MAG: site-specific integrase [Lachnospiraceae bacterium]|nr:site-specific integrase [Lachnospiraceae bacterium]
MSKEKNKLSSLQSILSYDNLPSEVTDAVLDVIRKEKEKQVLQVHKYKISGPFVTKKQTIYSTRCPWLESEKINRSSYNDVIDYLYDHYFGSTDDRVTVCEIYERMINEYEEAHILNDLTLVHYKADWNKHVVGKRAKWLNKPITEVLLDQIYVFYRELTADGTMKRSTFNNVKTVINAVFDYAITRGIDCKKASLISTNKLKFAPVSDKWEGVYSKEDRKNILTVCENMRPTVYTKAIELMFCLDIRIGELRALQKGDIDLEAKTVHIRSQMVDKKTGTAKRHPVRSNIMKGGKEAGKRIEPLSERALSVIVWLFENYDNSEWLLPNRSGNGPIYTNGFNSNLKKICEKEGVKYFSSHGIRFHNISAMYDAGISEKEIQRLSGHTTANMMRHYNKTISNACEDDKIREVLG